jgi:S-formylglutathione hydrolase FrmB
VGGGLTGRWHDLSIESDALRGNPLGDPATRPLWVWTPANQQRPLPTLYLLHGMTSQGRTWFNVSPFAKNVPELVDELCLDAIVVLVDGWTGVGGSQWIDSPAIGNYGTYLCEDVVGFVDASFSVSSRALAGRSSGGIGAATWAMLRPDLFAGFASHAGDALFEVMYSAEFAAAAQALRNLYDGSVDRFWEDLRSGRPVFENRTDPLLQNICAAAAAYSAGELPFTIDTGELIPGVWERWLEWDPVRLAVKHAEALRAARAIWIDAGRNDEYRLDLGAKALANAARAAGVSDDVLRFELHEGTHRGTNWRLLLSLAYLAERLES